MNIEYHCFSYMIEMVLAFSIQNNIPIPEVFLCFNYSQNQRLLSSKNQKLKQLVQLLIKHRKLKIIVQNLNLMGETIILQQENQIYSEIDKSTLLANLLEVSFQQFDHSRFDQLFPDAITSKMYQFFQRTDSLKGLEYLNVLQLILLRKPQPIYEESTRKFQAHCFNLPNTIKQLKIINGQIQSPDSQIYMALEDMYNHRELIKHYLIKAFTNQQIVHIHFQLQQSNLFYTNALNLLQEFAAQQECDSKQKPNLLFIQQKYIILILLNYSLKNKIPIVEIFSCINSNMEITIYSNLFNAIKSNAQMNDILIQLDAIQIFSATGITKQQFLKYNNKLFPYFQNSIIFQESQLIQKMIIQIYSMRNSLKSQLKKQIFKLTFSSPLQEYIDKLKSFIDEEIQIVQAPPIIDYKTEQLIRNTLMQMITKCFPFVQILQFIEIVDNKIQFKNLFQLSKMLKSNLNIQQLMRFFTKKTHNEYVSDQDLIFQMLDVIYQSIGDCEEELRIILNNKEVQKLIAFQPNSLIQTELREKILQIDSAVFKQY